MPSIELPDNVTPESLGLVMCYGEVYYPSHNVVNTREDGPVAAGDHVDCQRCGESTCHDENRDEHMTHIEDVGQNWCSRCVESHADYDEDTETYNSRTDAHIRGYHATPRSIDPADEDSPFRMGFEVEKEDKDVRKKLKTNLLPIGWAVERDSSLDAQSGFEIVTKAYNLRNMESLHKDAKEADWALKGKFSTSCGGHIHISDMRYPPKEFFKRIRPIFPLFMALFPKRLARRYCKAAKSYAINDQKYNAFRFTAHTIELRCPSAVRSAKNLLWRAELVKLILLSSRHAPLSWDWMKKQLAPNGRVRAMLIDAYCDKTREKDKEGMVKVNRVVKMTAMFSLWFRDDSRLPHDSVRAYLERAEDGNPTLASDDEFVDDHGELTPKENDVSRHNREQLDRVAVADDGSLDEMLVLVEYGEEEPTPTPTTQPADNNLPF